MYLNDGKPYHVMPPVLGVPPLWPEAKEGDVIEIHNGTTIKRYEFKEGDWRLGATAYVHD